MIRLLQGNCLTVMPTLEPASVDMVLVDLPYGTTSCSWDSIIPLEPLWAAYSRLVKPDAALVFTASQPFTSKLVISNIQQFRHEWIYQKRCASNFAQAAYAPMKEHESVLVFGKQRVRYFPIKEARNGSGSERVKHKFSVATRHKTGEFVSAMSGEFNDTADELRFPSSVKEFNNRAKGDRGFHPTQKPVALMEYLLETYTKPGDTVLDNCMGSGTTGVACINTGRSFIGIENDPDYFAVAEKRIAEAQNNKGETQ